MNKVVCPICQKAGQVKGLISKSEGQSCTGTWSCGRCRHLWRAEPWKTPGSTKFFGEAKYTQIEHAERIYAVKKKLFEKFVKWADEFNPQEPKLMLDFGCSYGTIMQTFKEHGWEVMGIEIAPTAQEVLDKRGLPWARCLNESGLARGSLDVVVMSDCICYLSNPVGTLREIRSYLRPDGRLFLRQPTRGGLIYLLSIIDRKKALADSLWLDHAHMFSRRSTAFLLEKSGFGGIRFIKERGYRRSLKGEIVHRLLHAIDCLTFGVYDLTLSWTVITKAR